MQMAKPGCSPAPVAETYIAMMTCVGSVESVRLAARVIILTFGGETMVTDRPDDFYFDLASDLAREREAYDIEQEAMLLAQYEADRKQEAEGRTDENS